MGHVSPRSVTVQTNSVPCKKKKMFSLQNIILILHYFSTKVLNDPRVNILQYLIDY
jgi:hypothetical protein